MRGLSIALSTRVMNSSLPIPSGGKSFRSRAICGWAPGTALKERKAARH
jgi:hypothetical protein